MGVSSFPEFLNGEDSAALRGYVALFHDPAIFPLCCFEEFWLSLQVWPSRKPGQPRLRVLRLQLLQQGRKHQEGGPFSAFPFSEQVLRISGVPGLG